MKSFIISDEQINSAKWIQKELPNDRIIISTGQNQLLQYFGQSKAFNVTANYFYEEKKMFPLIQRLKIKGSETNDATSDFKAYSDFIQKNNNRYIQSYLNSEDMEEKDRILKKAATENLQLSKLTLSKFNIDNKNKANDANIYIYYTEIVKKNPYINRVTRGEGYWGLSEKDRERLIFDKNPDKFQKIYSNYDGSIMIWKIL